MKDLGSLIEGMSVTPSKEWGSKPTVSPDLLLSLLLSSLLRNVVSLGFTLVLLLGWLLGNLSYHSLIPVNQSLRKMRKKRKKKPFHCTYVKFILICHCNQDRLWDKIKTKTTATSKNLFYEAPNIVHLIGCINYKLIIVIDILEHMRGKNTGSLLYRV